MAQHMAAERGEIGESNPVCFAFKPLSELVFGLKSENNLCLLRRLFLGKSKTYLLLFTYKHSNSG
jgi:hypothetical protein